MQIHLTKLENWKENIQISISNFGGIGIAMKVKSIPYFLVSTVSDSTFEVLEAKFGIKGYAIAIKLLCRIYGIEGYFCYWNDDIRDVFASNLRVGAPLVSEVVEFLLVRGWFNREKFDSLGILTSTAIQEHYLKANSRRKEIEMLESFLCINFSKNVYRNLKIVDKNGDIVSNFTGRENKGNINNKSNINVNLMEREEEKVKEMFAFELKRPLERKEEILLERLVSSYDSKLIEYALRESIIAEKISIAYVEGILKNWKERGITAELYEEMN